MGCINQNNAVINEYTPSLALRYLTLPLNSFVLNKHTLFYTYKASFYETGALKIRRKNIGCCIEQLGFQQ